VTAFSYHAGNTIASTVLIELVDGVCYPKGKTR
jgi:hypothetical protein